QGASFTSSIAVRPRPADPRWARAAPIAGRAPEDAWPARASPRVHRGPNGSRLGAASLRIQDVSMADLDYDTPLETLAGEATTLASYAGKVLLIVNTASQCGFTPQYAGLEALYRRFQDRGLVVLGFPCDQFGHQEPGTGEEIASFCERNFGVTFPMHAKLDVNGDGAHPLFVRLKKAAPGLL